MIRVSQILTKLVMWAAVGVLLTTSVFAQVYYPATGTGNVINLPLAEATNGAFGVGASAYGPAPGALSAYAYVPRGQNMHRGLVRGRSSR
jgi:hypothetical protein